MDMNVNKFVFVITLLMFQRLAVAIKRSLNLLVLGALLYQRF